MPNWLAALIVGVVMAGVGLIIIQSSRSGLKKASIVPEKTTETLQEDKQWLKEQIK
jgi:hypothetical protein